MRNEDMPANPIDYNAKQAIAIGNELEDGSGETKLEKAFWQVYSAMLVSGFSHHSPEDLAKESIEAVNAGFKALEDKD